MSGIVQGGWEFVIAAYVATAVALGGYAASIFLRLAAEKRRASHESKRETSE
jgi:hypothetical protein